MFNFYDIRSDGNLVLEYNKLLIDNIQTNLKCCGWNSDTNFLKTTATGILCLCTICNNRIIVPKSCYVLPKMTEKYDQTCEVNILLSIENPYFYIF